MNWKQTAEQLYFKNAYTMTEISRAVGVSVASVSNHLNALGSYQIEKLKRQANNQDRTDYYRQKKRIQRAKQRYDTITAETIREEQKIAAAILSKERFFYE